MNGEQRRKAILIVNHYDSKAQKIKCCEELAELQTAMLKHINKGGHYEDVLEEMADVYVMLEQMKCIFPFGENTLEDKIEYKLQRQLDRIHNK